MKEDEDKRGFDGNPLFLILLVTIVIAVVGLLTMSEATGGTPDKVPIESTPESSIQARTATLSDPVGRDLENKNVAVRGSEAVSESSS